MNPYTIIDRVTLGLWVRLFSFEDRENWQAISDAYVICAEARDRVLADMQTPAGFIVPFINDDLSFPFRIYTHAELNPDLDQFFTLEFAE